MQNLLFELVEVLPLVLPLAVLQHPRPRGSPTELVVITH